MPSTAEVADALVSELNATAFSLPFVAVRTYLPLYDLGEMADLHVTVVPTGRTVVPIHRSAVEIDHRCELAIQQKVPGEDAAACDPLLALAAQIARYIAGKRLADAPDAQWVKTEHAPLIAPEHLHELRQVTSLLAITYRTWERL